jgi:Fe-Mn family superoxide dismutase
MGHILTCCHICRGHINHTLFWENLAPKSSGGGEPPTGALASAINDTWGSLDAFKKTFNTHLAGIQGSGWSWLVKDTEIGELQIISLAVSYYSRVMIL